VDVAPTGERRGMVLIAGGKSRTYNMSKNGSSTRRDAMNKKDGMIRSEGERG
jgi:hypothetical protein